MEFIKLLKDEAIGTIVINRGKVNALNETVVYELQKTLIDIEKDSDIKAIILTGANKFFSFGFDIPGFLSYTRQQFTDYLIKFTNLYTYLFTFPKPVVAAINGHAIAGGCMLATACDKRIMVDGKAKISLNEITFGASVFAGSIEMLKFCVGSRNATEILYSGAMYSAEEALAMNLIGEVASEKELMKSGNKIAKELGDKSLSAFTGLKKLLRNPIAEEMKKRELESIKNFVDIWYSDSTFKNLQQIKIY